MCSNCANEHSRSFFHGKYQGLIWGWMMICFGMCMCRKADVLTIYHIILKVLFVRLAPSAVLGLTNPTKFNHEFLCGWEGKELFKIFRIMNFKELQLPILIIYSAAGNIAVAIEYRCLQSWDLRKNEWHLVKRSTCIFFVSNSTPIMFLKQISLRRYAFVR